jgi:hypothetical protein
MATLKQGEVLPLRYSVLAILSLVAAERGKTKIPVKGLYEAFAHVVDEVPDKFPRLAFTRTPYYVYSKRLDDAIQYWVGYGIEVPILELQCVEIGQEAAERHLARLKSKFGAELIDGLSSAASSFFDEISKQDTA